VHNHTERPARAAKVCTIDGCDGRRIARGWCAAHYERWRQDGDPRADVPIHRLPQPTPCLVPWCSKQSRTGSVCGYHCPSASGRAYRGEPSEWIAWALKTLPGDLCWLWPYGKNTDGYGFINGVRAHRHVLELVGRPVPEGLEVLHQCDTPACINPAHLKHGTHSENIQEMFDRGRAGAFDRTGLNKGRWRGGPAKLSEDDVREIRRRPLTAGAAKRGAVEFGIARVTYYAVRARRARWDVPEEIQEMP